MKPTLTIIGAGKVGSVLGRLFHIHGAMSVQDIFSRTAVSAESARAFIGAGTVVRKLDDVRSADAIMLSVPDDQIGPCCTALRAAGKIGPRSVVFHCSGALAADVLRQTAQDEVASLHPMRSFADPTAVAAGFAGTLCTLEGSPRAVALLDAALRQVDARPVAIRSEHKALYHAGAVFAANYLVTLMDAALQTLQAAGIEKELAMAMAQPLAQEAFDNVFRLGARDALTGPIARGDTATVARHEAALQNWDPVMADLYRQLAVATTRLAAQSSTK